MDPVAALLMTLLVWCVYVILTIADLDVRVVRRGRDDDKGGA